MVSLFSDRLDHSSSCSSSPLDDVHLCGRGHLHRRPPATRAPERETGFIPIEWGHPRSMYDVPGPITRFDLRRNVNEMFVKLFRHSPSDGNRRIVIHVTTDAE